MPVPERLHPTFVAAHTSAPARTERSQQARDRLIVALDFPDRASALDLADRLEDTCRWFKVGLELFVAAGPSVLEPLLKRGFSIFLDLKFHDIPNTVAAAVRSAASLGVRMMNVHALAGPAVLAAARHALDAIPDPPQLLAVTMITSMDRAQMTAAGLERSPAVQVELLARMGLDAGIRGFVCSSQEAASLRKLAGPQGVLVVPGIRPAGAEIADQKRFATPAEALRQGATYLVVGRPINAAPDPAQAADAILKEMADAL